MGGLVVWGSGVCCLVVWGRGVGGLVVWGRGVGGLVVCKVVWWCGVE